MKKNLILAVLCGVSLLVNALLFLVVRNCYREKSPDEKSELEKYGMTCVYNGGSVGLYERRGARSVGKRRFEAYALASADWRMPESNWKPKGGGVSLSTWDLPDDSMDGKGPRRRKRVVCACGRGLFFSYVIDDSGTCSSFLVQNGDSTVYYISAVGGRSVKFPYANLTSLPMQERLLSVVDEAKGGVE